MQRPRESGVRRIHMTLSPLHANARANASQHARSIQLERRLARFQPHVQPRVRALANAHPRLKDLALSFPALLFALAVPRPGRDMAHAIARVIEGAPLKELACAAGIPLWLRGVAAPSFRSPLPDLPDGDLFRRQIGNYLPRAPRQFDAWAQTICDAHRWADQAVALWVARELSRQDKKIDLRSLKSICLWAWCSRNCTFEGVLEPAKRWSPAMQFDTAMRFATWWLRHVDLHLNLGREPIADLWLTPASIDGYDFVPLRTAADVAAEAEAMRHCVLDYGSALTHDRCRVWSMQQDGRRIATLEVGCVKPEPLARIVQLKSALNKTVPTEAWLIARRWFDSHDLLAVSRPRIPHGTLPLNAAEWRRVWRRYWVAKKHIPPWLPLTPCREALGALCNPFRDW